LHLKNFISTVRTMRYLVWIAVFSLQLGIFVCGAGIDVCYADSNSSQTQLTPSQSGDDHPSTPINTCVAHAAHVFLSQPAFHPRQSDDAFALYNRLAAPNLLEISHLIEQPPKTSYS